MSLKDTNNDINMPINFKKENEKDATFTGEKLDQNFNHLSDKANNCIDVYGSNGMQADLKMNGNSITGMADGIAIDDGATVRQLSSSIFAEDTSSEATKIDLTEVNTTTVNSYKDGMVIYFRAKNNSVNDMSVQINKLGYKKLKEAGIGSIGVDGGSVIKKLIYIGTEDCFILGDEFNKPLDVVNITSFSDLRYNTRIWCTFTNPPKDLPATGITGGFIETIYKDNTSYQTFYADNNVIYIRRSSSDTWESLATNNDLSKIAVYFS